MRRFLCLILILSLVCNTPCFVQSEDFKVLYTIRGVSVREKPFKSSKTLGKVKLGKPLRVLGKKKNWYKVIYGNKSGYVHQRNLSVYNIYKVLRVAKDIDSSYVTEVMAYYNILPLDIRESFERDSLIRITRVNLSKRFFKGTKENIVAVTVYNNELDNCTIYINAQRGRPSAILHEMGHYVDGKLDCICKSKSFSKIYKRELPILKSVYNTDENNLGTAHEYFAEVFFLYFTNNLMLQKYCPKTYRFIKDCVREL